ncbi:hypothetical protein ACHQM5_009661 [Ranunculus cassubicifolius]
MAAISAISMAVHFCKMLQNSIQLFLSTHRRTLLCMFRSPVEWSCCVDSLMPYHTATSSALLTSMISISHRSCWFPEACNSRPVA